MCHIMMIPEEKHWCTACARRCNGTGFETLIGSGFSAYLLQRKGYDGDIILSVNGQQVYDRVCFIYC